MMARLSGTAGVPPADEREARKMSRGKPHSCVHEKVGGRDARGPRKSLARAGCGGMSAQRQ